MNNYENELREKWNAINYHFGGSLQLAIEHPLDWYVRYVTQDQRSVVIISDTPVDKIDSSKSIETACNPRKDGKYAISFTLMDRNQEDVFITMSGDIIEFSRVESIPQSALMRVLRRYAAWMKLLDHKHNALLGINAQKGLIGELLYLKEIIEFGLKPSEAVAGWLGPDGADQDFSYDDGWHEIKVTGLSSAFVSISSIEQLDSDALGELIIFRIDRCAPAQPGAFTLYKLVHSIFDLMLTDVGALDDFVLKLGSAGYIDMPEYDKQFFVFSSKQAYCVNEGFPRMRRQEVSTEIINAEYQLSIPSLAAWAK